MWRTCSSASRQLEADLAHVDVRHAGVGALLAQLPAPPPDPGRGLVELLARRAVVLGLGAPVGDEVAEGERAVPQEAGPDRGPLQRRLQARG
jgi:hypothetical protein